MQPFFSRLSYSFGNEDWNTELSALQLKPESEVLCITASGDRPLNLLSSDCKRIHAVDANPIQTALFDLKKTALKQLSYEEYVAFLGLDPMKHRRKQYKDIKSALDRTSQRIWDKHHRKIHKGVLFQGTVEQLTSWVARILHITRRKKIKKLFEFDNLAQQARFMDEEFDSFLWRSAMRLFLHPKMVCAFLRDPGLTDHVDDEIHVGTHLHDRLHNALKRFLAKESILISLLFTGSVDRNHLPPYLSEEGVTKIRDRLDKITYETTDLLTHLEQCPEETYDRFSLSDVASYMPYETYEKMVTLMVRAAKPGARFCLRQFLSNYKVPEALSPYLKRDRELEQKLEKEDRCCLYRFFVGEVVK